MKRVHKKEHHSCCRIHIPRMTCPPKDAPVTPIAVPRTEPRWTRRGCSGRAWWRPAWPPRCSKGPTSQSSSRRPRTSGSRAKRRPPRTQEPSQVPLPTRPRLGDVSSDLVSAGSHSELRATMRTPSHLRGLPSRSRTAIEQEGSFEGSICAELSYSMRGSERASSALGMLETAPGTASSRRPRDAMQGASEQVRTFT